jgi:uncharacterized protein (DUF885 family)
MGGRPLASSDEELMMRSVFRRSATTAIRWLRVMTLGVVSMTLMLAHAHAASDEQDAALHKLFDDYFEETLRLNPLLATFIGDSRYDDRLTNFISPEHIRAASEVDKRYLAEARKFEKRPLSEADRLSLEILIHDLEASIEGARYPAHLVPVSQFFSIPSLMGMLGSGTSAQPFANAADYDKFLKRMNDYVAWSDQAIVNMREGVKRGITHPRLLMEKVLPQLADLASTDPKTNIFYRPLENLPEAIPATERSKLTQRYRDAIEKRIAPAYRRLHDYIRDEYIPKARTSSGWSALPNGSQWYAYLAKQSTTTDLTPDAIHQIGLDEVARIRGEMLAVKEQVGFKGDLAAFFEHLKTDERYYFDNAAALIEGYETLKAKIDARLPQLFSHFPKAAYEVRPVEAFRAQSAAGASYMAPSADGTRPGVFYVNTFNLNAQPKFGMETLSLHEAAPGHHFQVAIQQELDALPRFRRFGAGYVAYQEGWALYAESLGKELGLFTDPYQYYGRLNDEMLRAMRLVVDTGLHTRNWTRERTIKYMLDNSSMADSDVESEVERYMAMPGQALGYKIGDIRIRELRTRAAAALGDRFDVREFHHQVLRDGAVPLDVLARKIDRWVAATKND